MDPFLPGEIPVMVLRYLAANKCENAALALIEEMPLLKGHVREKPPKVSNSDYVKHLARSSVNAGLKDVLTDYGNSKILAEEILENESNVFANVPSESLLSKLNALQELMKKPTTSSANTSPVANSPNNLSSASVKVDGFTNTEEFYKCPQCLVNQANQKEKTDSTCQTDEVTAVQFGLDGQDQIPVIFYRTLLNDDDLQQKIAQTINEHLEDPQGSGNDVVQKISSKTENEIDKFLVDLLQDMPDDSNEAEGDVRLQNLVTNRSVASIYAEVDSNLSAMFGEAEMLFGTEAAGSNSQANTERATKKLLPSTSADQDSKIKDVTSDTPSILNSSSCTLPNTEAVSSNSCDTDKPQSSSSGLKTPKQPRRGSSVKRITPTPLTSANINPVFNTSVVIEKQSMDLGENSPEFSVVTVNSDIPPWQKLKRKPIAPKIPSMGPPKVTENVTVIRTEGRKSCHPKAVTVSASATNDYESDRSETSPTRAKEPVSIQAPSSNKRKTHPSKLTPEKAKSSYYNFRFKSNESNTISNDTCAKKTPIPSSSTVELESNVNPSGEINSVPLVNENSQNDVTPMQPPPPREIGSSSDLKTISPSALHRLIASANKLSSAAPPIHFHKRKSYSTPRKRKHVRSLSFTTPPSLKAVTPHSGPANDASKKRKANDEWHAAELKSKKRLNWPESEKKKGLDVVVPHLGTSKRSEISDKQESTMKNLCHATATEEGSKESSKNSEDNASKKLSMSTILEESVVEPSQSIAYVTIPPGQIDSSMPYHYVQLGDDTQSLYPIHFTSFTPGPSGMNPASLPALLPAPFTVVHSASEPNPAFQTMSFHAQASNQLPPVTYSFQTTELPSQSYNVQSIPPLQTAAPHPEPNPVATLSSKPYISSIFSPVQPPEQGQPTRHIIPPVSSLATHSQNSSGLAPTTEQPPSVQNITPTMTQKQTNSEIHESSAPTMPQPDPSVKKQTHSEVHESSAPTMPLPNPSVKKQTQSEALESSAPTMPQPNPSVRNQTHCEVLESSAPKKSGKRKSRNRSAELPVPNNVDTVPPLATLPSSQTTSTKPLVNPSEFSTTANELNSQANPDSTRRTRRRCKSGETSSENLSPFTVDQETSRRTRQSARISEINKHPKPEVTVEKPVRVSSGSRKSRSQSQNIDSSTVELEDEKNQEVNKKGGNKKEKGSRKGAQKKSKPKLTMNVLELFGDSPSRTKSVKSRSRRSPEAVSAQMVAAEAVALGSPRRSPRKHPMMKKHHEEESPFSKQLSNFGSLSPNENTENSFKSLSLLPPQENTVFNIVPAPLGFPEPTPIKNFIETGFLNISNIGFNSPLITPLKSNPPPSLNETHFTLPPTPRVVVDQDSNSNSTHSLRLTYDGLYPANLLTSTPLKFGLPKTPGRESSSSNSRSPIPKPEGDLLPSHGEPAQRLLLVQSQVEPPPPPPQLPLHAQRLVEPLQRSLLPPSQVELPKLVPSPTSQLEPQKLPQSQVEHPWRPPPPLSQVELPKRPLPPQGQVEPPRRPPPPLKQGERQKLPLPPLSQGEPPWRPQPPLSQVEPPQRPSLSPPINQQQRTANNATTKAAIANNTALDLSSPRHVDKSDGELSSSDDDDDKASSKLMSRKQVQKVIPLQPPPPTGTSPPRRSSNMIPRNYSSTTQVVHPVQKLHQSSVSHSQSIPGISPISQMDGLGRSRFRVAGKDKMLTFSEHETLVCLMEMRNTGKAPEIVKENAPIVHQPAVVANLQQAGAEDNNPFKILQKKSLADLLKLVKKKFDADSQN